MSSDLTALDKLASGLSATQRCYLKALVETYNHKARAAEAVGISVWTPRRWKSGYSYRKGDHRTYVPPDPDYLDALDIAEELAAERLEDFAIQRAVEGRRSYKFHAKSGEPLRHPTMCLCGHSRTQHPTEGECGVPGCECSQYVGEPYFEHDYSDKLITFLLRGVMPDRYAERVHVGAQLANIDLTRLPDQLVARIAAGENPLAVLASAGEEARDALEPAFRRDEGSEGR